MVEKVLCSSPSCAAACVGTWATECHLAEPQPPHLWNEDLGPCLSHSLHWAVLSALVTGKALRFWLIVWPFLENLCAFNRGFQYLNPLERVMDSSQALMGEPDVGRWALCFVVAQARRLSECGATGLGPALQAAGCHTPGVV